MKIIREGDPHDTVTATGQRIQVKARVSGLLIEETGKIVTEGELANALSSLGWKCKKRGVAKGGVHPLCPWCGERVPKYSHGIYCTPDCAIKHEQSGNRP